jgi:hypothetical protein
MKTKRAPRWPLLAALLLVLLVAAGLRLVGLPDLPAGLHYDEAANGILAAEIAQGIERPVFIPSYTGKEVLFFYWTAAWMRMLGQNMLALRLTAAVVGLCTVASAAWSTYELLHDRPNARWIAILAAAFLATSFWHLLLSRLGFRAITQPLLQALTVGALWRGLRTKRKRWLVLAGALCGATAYTYLAARAFPLPLAVALLALLAIDRGHRLARLGQIALFVAAAAVVIAPLVVYFASHPDALTTRMGQVAAASWDEAWYGIRAVLGMLFIQGDPYIRFNIPGLPIFTPVVAALFLLGFPLLFVRSAPAPDRPAVRWAARVFLLTVLPVMMLPSALATGEITPSNLRAVGMMPFIYVFPALALTDLATWIGSRLRHPNLTRWVALIALLLALTPLTVQRYFGDWATSAALYDAADGDLVDVARYLNQTDLGDVTPYVASIHYRHPTLAFLARDYGALKWVTGGETAVFPGDRDALLILPRSADDGRAWMETQLEPLTLDIAPPAPGDEPAFHAYHIPAGASPRLDHSLGADFGPAVTLEGYEILAPARSGETVELLLAWRVNAPAAPGDLLPMARLTDRWGGDWGSIRPFHYPAEQWTPGEIIVDHLSVPVAPGAPPGGYRIEIGLYAESTGASIPLLDDEGSYAGLTASVPVTLERASDPPSMSSLGIRRRTDLRADAGLTLLGFNLDTSAIYPGEPLFLTLFWQANNAPEEDFAVELALGDTLLYRGAPVHDTYPTGRWTAGEIVADRYSPRLPLQAAAGTWPLTLRLVSPEGNVALETELDQVTVEETDRVFAPPSPEHPLSIPLGGRVALLGYDLDPDQATPGEQIMVTLYWQALAEMATDYTVFTHLLGADGAVITQNDTMPVAGAYPTTLWVAGEFVADPHPLDLPSDLAPGTYTLEVGMYVVASGDRLSVPDDPNGAVYLPVTVTP